MCWFSLHPRALWFLHFSSAWVFAWPFLYVTCVSCLSWTRMQITVGRSTLIKWVLVQSSTNTENSGRESKKPPEKNRKSPGNTHSQGYVTKLQRTTKQKNNWRLRQHTSMHPVCARRSNWFKSLLEQGRQWQISQVMREKISSVVHVFIYKKK